MNKKEAAELAEAKKHALINRALRWTDGAKRDLPPPAYGSKEHTQGFDYNAYNLSVYDAWSSCIYNGQGIKINDSRQAASQNPRPLFSTKTLALKAMRAEIEMDTAIKLAEIDAKITALAESEKS